MKKIINTSNAPEPIGPYSQAVLANGVLYVSGQIALDPTFGTLKNASLEEETKQVMENIGGILEEAGMTYSNIVKCSIFIKNMDDFALINEVYGQFFESDPPARETVEVARLPKDVNVEISCIACK